MKDGVAYGSACKDALALDYVRVRNVGYSSHVRMLDGYDIVYLEWLFICYVVMN